MSDSDSQSPLNNLRQFRFKKRIVKKMNTSDDDSNLGGDLQLRRRAVNRIEDSDSEPDASSKANNASPPGSSKSSKSNSPVNNDSDGESSAAIAKDYMLQQLAAKFAEIDIQKIEQILNDNEWNSDKAEKILLSSSSQGKKRQGKHSSKRKTKKRKTNRHEDCDIDSDENEGTYKGSKVFDSDDDSDVEVSDDLTGDKKAVLEFMQNAMAMELLLINHCSQKRVNAIVESRPFRSWSDLVYKFQSVRYLDTDLLNSAQDLIATRSVIEVLMKKCLRLSGNMEKAVAAGAHTLKQQPAGISEGLQLTPYQMVGLNWLAVMHAQNVNGILADEMGLGKTVQVIAFLTYLKETGLADEVAGPHIIVVPSSTMENWMNELERWSPGLTVVQYYGSQEERKEMRMNWRYNHGLDDVDIILTTYNLVTSTPEERKLFRVLPIHYVVFDEAHMLKNMSTVRYENLVKLNAKHRILLTGTPLQNNLLELMSLLIFVMPAMFERKKEDLKSLFSKNPKITADKKNSDRPLFEQEQVKNAKQIMKPFILRRLKEEVLRDLPVKSEEVVHCPMIPEQKKLYKDLVQRFSVEADRSAEVNGMAMMMQLRKLANHPLLTRNYYDEFKLREMAKRLASEYGYKQKNPEYVFEDLCWMSDYQINQLSRTYKSVAGYGLPQELVPKSGKLKKLDELLPTLKEDNHRVLIFSQFTMVLDILVEYLTIRGHKFLRLDGQTPVVDRQSLIDQYNEDSSIFIFLLSTRAGGLGINLTAADHVIIHDIDFNPYNDKQAEDRCHRVGQTKPVTIIRLLGKKTIEEGMYEIAQEKLQLEQQVTGQEENEGADKKSVIKLLKATLGLEKPIVLSPTKGPNGSSKFVDNNVDCGLEL